MSFDITVEGGKKLRLLTTGKYCDRDIVINPENLDSALTEQDNLIANIQSALQGKAGGGESTPTQEKSVEVTKNGEFEVLPDEGYALSKVVVSVNVPIPDGYIVPSGTLEIAENGTYDVTEKAEVVVNVPTGGGSGGDLGGLTKYAKIIATPSTTTSFVIENPLGGIAKKVSVRRTTDVAISSRRCQKYLADFELGIGAAQYVDTGGTARYVVTKTEGTVNNTYFKMTEGTITLYRYNASNVWDNTAEYEVEIWQ